MDPQLAIGQFLTLTGGAALIVAIVELVKRTLAWTDALTTRFGPLASVIAGVLVFLAATVISVGTTGSDLTNGAFGGFVCGLYAAGLYNLAGAAIIQSIAPRTPPA